MKYETSLDLSFNNTMSIFVENIEPNSIVLEFGPASGRLTKYLKEEKNCTVYIVEIDEEAGKIAAQYAKDYIIGDILDYEWVHKFASVEFDYILFADVLEHLKDAKTVLKKAAKLLSKSGKICLSVPNIAHNSVIIDLLNNNFNYTSTGLLDNTHVHFYTKYTVDKLVEESGLYVAKRYATYSQVGKNEFNNTYQLKDDYIAEYLKTRYLGEVYQYVYIITTDSSVVAQDNIVEYSDYLYSQCLFDYGNGYTDDIKYYLKSEQNSYVFTYENIREINKLRFDPLNNRCIVRLVRAEGLIGAEKVSLKFDSTNAMCVIGDCYYFGDDDSQIHFITEHKKYDKIIIEVEYIHCNRGVLTLSDTIVEQMNHEKNIIEQKDNYINDLNKKINDNVQNNQELNKKINNMEYFLQKKPIKTLYNYYCRKNKI